MDLHYLSPQAGLVMLVLCRLNYVHQLIVNCHYWMLFWIGKRGIGENHLPLRMLQISHYNKDNNNNSIRLGTNQAM